MRNPLLHLLNKFFTWLEGLVSAFPEQQPSQPPTTLLQFIWHYTRPFKWLLIVATLISIALAIIEVRIFAYIGEIIDRLNAHEPAEFWQLYGSQYLWFALLIIAVIPILKLVYESLTHQGLLGNFAMRLRWQIHRYLLRQSMQFFQDDFAGRLAAKMMQTSLAVRDSVIKVCEVLVYVTIYFLAGLISFAAADWRFALPMLLWLIGYAFVLRHFIPRLRDISMQQAEARSMVTGRAVDSYTNIATVKMFSQNTQEDAYAKSGMLEFLRNVYLQMRLTTLLSITLHTLNAWLLFSALTVALWLWSNDAISAGAIAFAMALIMRLNGMSQWVLWEVWGLFENIGVVEDGMTTIAQRQSIVDDPTAKPLTVHKGCIEYRNITFNYGKDLNSEFGYVLDNLKLRIAAGEKIGVVGRSGAGKSTLVNLLLRFYETEAGSIFIDDQDIRRVSQESLRRHIGVVTQDTSLLHRTIAENISYGTAHSDRTSIVTAAKRAKAHEFISQLEDSHGNQAYDAEVGERGVKLSGGQRQRIAIARVLLKNAPILILDEATSALDSEVEMAIQESLHELMANKTVIAIAHRLSTIAAMDRLVVMDKGRIIEQGDHQTLVDAGGLYADLWARQSGGFLLQQEDTEDTD